jgi:hypothetical protein
MKSTKKDPSGCLSGVPYHDLAAEIARRNSALSWAKPGRFSAARAVALAKARDASLTSRRAKYIEKTMQNAQKTEENIAQPVIA